jgi:hypothetical protein
LLAQAKGKYRCNKCQKVNNAFESLFDQWPEPGDQAPGTGNTPILGIPISLDDPDEEYASPEEAFLTDGEDDELAAASKASDRMQRAVWITAAFALLIIAVINITSYYRQPLLDHELVKSTLVRAGVKDPPAEKPFENLALIELVNREMRTHPSQPGTLQLSATLVNRAKRFQAYPRLDVTLLDISGEAVANRLFEPVEYLSPGADVNTGMTPQAFLPITLELVDPGDSAVGFELEFR